MTRTKQSSGPLDTMHYDPTEAELRKLYRDVPQVKFLSDMLHRARSIPGPEEDSLQCIRIAVIRLGIEV